MQFPKALLHFHHDVNTVLNPKKEGPFALAFALAKLLNSQFQSGNSLL